MKFDVCAFSPALGDVATLARECEAIGFDGMWFTETSHNPYLAAAVAGSVTTHMTLGSAIAVAFPRSPMVTAQAAWDLAQSTNGRFILGLGTQVKAHMERRFSVPFEHPGPRLREYVLAVKAIFRSFQGWEPLQFKGDFYDFSLLTDFFNGGQIARPDIPIYIAGVNPGMARIAGSVADGLHVHPIHSRQYLKQVLLPAVSDGARATNRDPDSIAVTIPVFTIIREGIPEIDDGARRQVQQQIAFYASTRTYRSVLEAHGLGDLSDRLHALQAQGDTQGMIQLTGQTLVEIFAVTATWEDLSEQLSELYDGVADRLFLYVPVTSWRNDPRALRRWRGLIESLSNS